MTPLHESPGRTRLHMPCTPAHVDETGHLHAGALASIVDIAAVAASWSLVPRRAGARGSTIAMQVSFPSTTTEAVVADAHVQQRSESLLFSTVHVTTGARGSSSRWDRSATASWSHGRQDRRESRVHPPLFEIELPLEVPQHVVVDRTLGPKTEERLAFRVDDRPPDLAVLDELSILAVGRRIALPLDVLRTVPIGIAQLIEKRAMPRPDRNSRSIRRVAAWRSRCRRSLSRRPDIAVESK